MQPAAFLLLRALSHIYVACVWLLCYSKNPVFAGCKPEGSVRRCPGGPPVASYSLCLHTCKSCLGQELACGQVDGCFYAVHTLRSCRAGCQLPAQGAVAAKAWAAGIADAARLADIKRPTAAVSNRVESGRSMFAAVGVKRVVCS